MKPVTDLIDGHLIKIVITNEEYELLKVATGNPNVTSLYYGGRLIPVEKA
jgi:hypothetical protein